MIHDLPPPNDGASHLTELQFGKERYEHLRYYPPTSKLAHPHATTYWVEVDHGHWKLRPDWRVYLQPSDPWALLPIYLDPSPEWVLDADDNPLWRLNAYPLWDPTLFQNMALLYPPVIKEVVRVAMRPHGPHLNANDFSPLYAAVRSFFRNDYREAYLTLRRKDLEAKADIYQARYRLPTEEQHWRKACILFDHAALRIAEFLVRHYDLYEDEWGTAVLDHVDLSGFWRKFTQPTLQPEWMPLKKDRSKLS